MIREVKILTGRGIGTPQDCAEVAEQARTEAERLQAAGLSVELQYQFSYGRPSVMVVASGATTEETRQRKATLHAIHERNANKAAV